MGILTSPKLMLPFQIARAIQNYFAWRDRSGGVTVDPSVRSWFFGAHRAALLQGRRKPLLYAASSSCWREIPRNSKSRISVSSIKLFGQDAPAVIPMTAGPLGSQK